MGEQKEHVFGEGEGPHVVLKTGRKKVPLEQISPMQWSCANVKILLELLRRGHLQETAMFDYLAYTVKIGELAESYTWGSILQYDRAYRQLQAQHGFRWASDSPHLTALHLKPRSTGHLQGKSTPPPKPGRRAGTSTGQASAANVCRLYNRNVCPYGKDCRFEHRCLAPNCGGNHPLALHGQKNNQPKNAAPQE